MTARASRTCRDTCRDRYSAVVGKTFPAFPAHAQHAILHIWQEVHGCLSLIGSAKFASRGHSCRSIVLLLRIRTTRHSSICGWVNWLINDKPLKIGDYLTRTHTDMTCEVFRFSEPLLIHTEYIDSLVRSPVRYTLKVLVLFSWGNIDSCQIYRLPWVASVVPPKLNYSGML